MRLVAKFCATLVGGLVVVLAAAGWLQVRRDLVLFERDTALDQEAMAQVLRSALEAVADGGGAAQAHRVVNLANRRQHRVTLRWIPLDEADSAVAGRLTDEQRAQLLGGHPVRTVALDETAGERRLTYVPIRSSRAPRPAAVEVSEPLAQQRAAIRSTETNVVALTVLSMVACALLTLALGVWQVGRPMRALAARAQRIGAGDLTSRLGLRRRDEIGMLARALDGMAGQLLEARERVAAETDARIAALEQLRHADRLRTVGQLAAGVAHELATPLSVVAARAKLLEVAAPDAAPRNAVIIQQQVERMTAIIRQLLDFSRRRRSAFAVADLGGLATRTAELLRSLPAARRVRVAARAPDEPVEALIDGQQVQQVLTNLVMNAMQAMPDGGSVDITVERRHARPPAGQGGPAGEWACVSVRDEGGGIPEDHRARIFQPFFTTKQVGAGTGLGLAVAWDIVSEHGGWIDVESRIGVGSTFRVYLPLGQAASMGAAGSA